MRINLAFDQSTTAAPPGFFTTMEEAANAIQYALEGTRGTFTIGVSYGNLGAGVLGEAGASAGETVSYQMLNAALHSHPNNVPSFIAGLPSTDPTGGIYGGWFIPMAQEKALGIAPSYGSEQDGYAEFSSTADWSWGNGAVAPGKFSAFGVDVHELTHALGRLSIPSLPTSFDLGAFIGGALSIDPVGLVRDFSVNGGKSSVAQINANSDPSDLNTATPDPFDALFTPGQQYHWTALDQSVMETLGYLR